MNETQKIYHELEMLQELGLLEKGTNICELTTQVLQDNQDVVQKDETFKEIENQMIVPSLED